MIKRFNSNRNAATSFKPSPKVPRTSLEILGFFKINPRSSLVVQSTFGTGKYQCL